MKILVLGDTHLPFTNWDAIEAAKQYANWYKPDLIIQIGDLVDGYNWSLYKRAPDSPSAELEWSNTEHAVRRFHEKFKKYQMVVLEGNHCLSDDTEVFCGDKWVHYSQVKEGDFVFGLNDSGVVVSQPVSRVVIKDYDGDLINYGPMAVTPEHRVLYRTQLNKFIGYKTAEELVSDELCRVQLPLSAWADRSSSRAPLTDAEIALAAWLLTDSHIGQRQVIFYQKPSGLEFITKHLDTIGIDYSINIRHRKITFICGKELKKEPQGQGEIKVGAASFDKLVSLISGDKQNLPSWVWAMSTNQFNIFMENLMLADGTMPKAGSYGTLYCSRKNLAGQIQALAALHGLASKFSEYTQPNGIFGRITLSRRSWGFGYDGTFSEGATKVKYTGKVWCLTVPTSNFMVRRNGSVFFTGNCRRYMLRAFEMNIPKSLIKTMDQMFNFDNWTWHLQVKPLVKDNIVFIHGDEMAGNAIQKSNRLGQNLVQGHDHMGYLQYTNMFNNQIFGMSVGCLIDGESIAAKYAAKNPLKCWIGHATITDGVPALHPFK